jgi:DNA-directed RNA polymerase specialized sigma24 family protein
LWSKPAEIIVSPTRITNRLDFIIIPANQTELDGLVFNAFFELTKKWIYRKLNHKYRLTFDIEQMALDVVLATIGILRSKKDCRCESWSCVEIRQICRTIAKRRVCNEIEKITAKKRFGTTETIEMQSLQSFYEDGRDVVDCNDLLNYVERTLSPRQVRIVRLRLDGSGPAEIARILGISPRSVLRHNISIAQKGSRLRTMFAKE